MIVPVLSNAIISIEPVTSNDSDVLNKIPCFAPIPLPTIIATGVARPNAHGHEITKTEIARAIENPILFPRIIQIINVTNAIPIITGTKIPDTWSAFLAIGALVAAASLTI